MEGFQRHLRGFPGGVRGSSRGFLKIVSGFHASTGSRGFKRRIRRVTRSIRGPIGVTGIVVSGDFRGVSWNSRGFQGHFGDVPQAFRESRGSSRGFQGHSMGLRRSQGRSTGVPKSHREVQGRSKGLQLASKTSQDCSRSFRGLHERSADPEGFYWVPGRFRATSGDCKSVPVGFRSVSCAPFSFNVERVCHAQRKRIPLNLPYFCFFFLALRPQWDLAYLSST